MSLITYENRSEIQYCNFPFKASIPKDTTIPEMPHQYELALESFFFN
jgi:hypothetical protein